ncbi:MULTISPECIES: ABC transporter permease [Staphylococcus]|uniref:ABC transporter permease n=1 Tax=Staphylococcus hsinchuensis TaxID=3051183 RepID=A0ABZ3EF89_9STAP|nr:ABC transporter permease [Staphylococcus sp. Marseille-Q5304]
MRLKAVFIRVIKELLRDKRTLALMFLAPLLVLTLMYFIFDTNTESDLKIGVNRNVPNKIVNAFPSDKVDTKTVNHPNSIKETIEDDNLDAYIEKDGKHLNITYKNEDPNHTVSTKQILASTLQKDKMQNMAHVMQKLPPQLKQNKQHTSEDMKLKHHYLYGDANSTYFDKLFPILIGVFVFFFVFLISGIALLRERTNGTLERLLATSIKRSEIVFGYMAGYGLFAIIQTLIIVLYSIYLLKIDIHGSIGWVLLTNILIALTALAIGIFVSTFANSEFQMIQFIPIVVIPQVFLSGIIPLDNIPKWISSISYAFPLRYGGEGLTDVMIKGQGLAHIWVDLAVLLLFIGVFTLLNIIGLKRYRKV